MEDLQGGTLALEHRYDLERRVPTYALVEAYSGTQQPFDRPVWVKVCEAPRMQREAELYDRLKRCILEVARFEHPRVARIVDFGDIDTQLPFWVVERVDDVTLAEYVERQGTLAPAEATEITARVSEVLLDAHRAGLVHGGISPRWISVVDDGVRLQHFAIQPTMHEIRTLDGEILSQDLLWALPPEQFADGNVAHSEASDAWALGALLYWMLTGVHPYLDDPTDTSEAILRLRDAAEAPELAELGFEQELSHIVAEALRPNPADRATLSELHARLAKPAPTSAAPLVAAQQEPAPPTTPTRRGPSQGGVGTALALALALLLLTNLAWLFIGTSNEPEAPASLPDGAPQVLPVGVQLRTAPEDAKILRIDGTTETEYGDAPLTLDPKAVPEGTLPLVIRKRGHRDVRLDVSASDEGHEIVLHLAPEGQQASSEE